jgi:DNA adenine methylase
MKTGFNGIWQLKGRANKGKEQAKGRFNTPCGLMNQTAKVYDKDNVLDWHKALQNATLLAGDFRDTLTHVKKGFYVFMDPPYRGSFADYSTQSDDQFQSDVVEFAHQCRDKGSLTLLSNRELDDGFFEERADGDKIVKFDVTYTAGRRKTEVDENGNEIFTATKAQEILMIGKTT